MYINLHNDTLIVIMNCIGKGGVRCLLGFKGR